MTVNKIVVKMEGGVGNRTVPLLITEMAFNSQVDNWSNNVSRLSLSSPSSPSPLLMSLLSSSTYPSIHPYGNMNILETIMVKAHWHYLLLSFVEFVEIFCED